MLSGLVVFPARVRTPDQTFDKAKLFVVDGVATVWQVVNRQITEVARLDVATHAEAPGVGMLKTHTLTSEDGVEWVVEKGSGCGCGSPLKRFQPEFARPLRASR
jgi:hypothetical protein